MPSDRQPCDGQQPRRPSARATASFGSDSENQAPFTAYVLGGRHGRSTASTPAGKEWLIACAGIRQTAGRPVGMAAVVDERGAPARTAPDRFRVPPYGRDFTAEEMALLRALIAVPHRSCRALSKRVLPAHRMAQARRRPQGHDGPRHHARHASDGLIELPPPRSSNGAGWRDRLRGHRSAAGRPTTLDKVRPLEMRAVVHSTREGGLWNEFVARYHYLGYKTLVGAQMRYAAHDRNGWPVAMLGFSTAAWKLAPRDNFIGWTQDKRGRTSRRGRQSEVSDIARSRSPTWLAHPRSAPPLPLDWTERYGTTPVLIETFVETPRYTGAGASCWTRVGTTRAGRYGAHGARKKDIWLRPLQIRRTLNR